MATDHYQLLGISHNASDKEITKSFRKLALKWHPDKNPDDRERAQRKFTEIEEAYAVLKDPKKKMIYDQTHSSAPHVRFPHRDAKAQAHFGSALPTMTRQPTYAQKHGFHGNMGRNGNARKCRGYIHCHECPFRTTSTKEFYRHRQQSHSSSSLTDIGTGFTNVNRYRNSKLNDVSSKIDTSATKVKINKKRTRLTMDSDDKPTAKRRKIDDNKSAANVRPWKQELTAAVLTIIKCITSESTKYRDIKAMHQKSSCFRNMGISTDTVCGWMKAVGIMEPGLLRSKSLLKRSSIIVSMEEAGLLELMNNAHLDFAKKKVGLMFEIRYNIMSILRKYKDKGESDCSFEDIFEDALRSVLTKRTGYVRLARRGIVLLTLENMEQNGLVEIYISFDKAMKNASRYSLKIRLSVEH